MIRTEILEKVKSVITDKYDIADCGIFNTHKTHPHDKVIPIYVKDTVTIYFSPCYNYLEVFGLNSDEFLLLRDYYNTFRENN